MASKKVNVEKRFDPIRHTVRQEVWAREVVKNSNIPKQEIVEYVPSIHNTEPYYRDGAKDAFKHPSLINGKRVPYWSEV